MKLKNLIKCGILKLTGWYLDELKDEFQNSTFDMVFQIW